ncbi:MAG: large conductance mechanosensitive channel protein MscL [Bacillota bacterium]
MKQFMKDFQTFITKGNIVELAIAVVIGTAFTRIVQSMVKDVIMPVVSLITGRDGFNNYKYVITQANEAENITENAIYYGTFIQNIFDFIIIAFVVFVFFRLYTHAFEKLTEKQRIEEARLKKEKAMADQAIKEQTKHTEDYLKDIKTLLEKNLANK